MNDVKYYKAKYGPLVYYKVINDDFKYKCWIYFPYFMGATPYEQKHLCNQWTKINKSTHRSEMIEISFDDLTLELI